MKVILYKEQTLKSGCDIALSNRLYVSGWNLSSNLKRARKTNAGEISIVYKDDKPIACAYADNRGHVDTFCRKSERRKGYGTLAVSQLDQYKEGKLKGSYGIDGSEKFYNKLKVKYVG